MENGGGSRDGKEGGDKKGKKQRGEPRRGPGIPKLEAMRMQDEANGIYSRNHLYQYQQPPPVFGTGINMLEANRMAMNPLPPYRHQPYPCRPLFQQQSIRDFARTLMASMPCFQQPGYGRGSVPYTVHPHSSTIAYGPGVPASPYYSLPDVRFGPSEAASSSNPSNMAPTTLPLFKETPDHPKGGESAYLNKEESHNNQPAAGGSTSSTDSDDDELDLDLKL